MIPNDDLALTWMVDSGQRESVHRNVPGLTYQESYLGHLERRKDVDGDWSWGYVLKGKDYVPAATYPQARNKLTEAALSIVCMDFLRRQREGAGEVKG